MSHYTWHNVTESSRITTKHAFATLSFIAEIFLFLYVGMDALDIEKWKFDGDPSTKKVKGDKKLLTKRSEVEDKALAMKKITSSKHLKPNTSSSNSSTTIGNAKANIDQLPKKLQGMKIRDDELNDKELEGRILKGNGIEAGQIISTTIDDQDDQSKQVYDTENAN